MTALLAIDAGNTRVKWGVYEQGERSAGGAVAHDALARIFSGTVPARVIASNVAGAHVAALLREHCAVAGAALTVIDSRASQCGVTNGYRNPAQLGTDRWAALIGAARLGAGAKLVVMAGTATTVDALTAEGVFPGGLIVPGVTLMRTALNRNTAQLGADAGQFAAFPQSTADAIMSGAVQASVGAVERMVAALRERAGSAPTVVLSGGAASELAPHLPFAATLREHLVLEGLVAIAAEVCA